MKTKSQKENTLKCEKCGREIRSCFASGGYCQCGGRMILVVGNMANEIEK